MYIMLLLFPFEALAWKVDPQIRIPDLKKIHVALDDQASGGCWTNIRETRDYAAGKIEILGGTIEEKFETADFIFAIGVLASRAANNTCIGSINVKFFKVTRLPNQMGGFFVLSESSGITSDTKNMNNFVLEVVASGINEWK